MTTYADIPEEMHNTLILAAPDLLDACKTAELRLSSFGEAESCYALNVLRVAIAKAEKGSN